MTDERVLTPPEIASRWRVNPDKVLQLIKSGQLRAMNLALNVNGKKSRYKILESELERFEDSRSTKPTSKATRRRRRTATATTKNYFE